MVQRLSQALTLLWRAFVLEMRLLPITAEARFAPNPTPHHTRRIEHVQRHIVAQLACTFRLLPHRAGAAAGQLSAAAFGEFLRGTLSNGLRHPCHPVFGLTLCWGGACAGACTVVGMYNAQDLPSCAPSFLLLARRNEWIFGGQNQVLDLLPAVLPTVHPRAYATSHFWVQVLSTRSWTSFWPSSR